MRVLPVLARVAVGLPFVWLGYEALTEPGMRVKMATDFGVPEEVAGRAVRLNGAAMALGGAGVATGVFPRASAAAVTAAMIPTTLAGHSFWREEDPAARKLNRIQFLKNLGMVGGLLAIAAATSRAPEDRQE
jgi:putative oxidoreductase